VPLLLVADGPEDPVTVALSRERRAELAWGLEQLSDVQRQVVVCRYLLELDEAETAAVLRWPRGTVKSRLHRAVRQLSETLARPGAARAGAHESREVGRRGA
jgi:RNA polymerase sigma-70 factor (ECF subfamily)